MQTLTFILGGLVLLSGASCQSEAPTQQAVEAPMALPAPSKATTSTPPPKNSTPPVAATDTSFLASWRQFHQALRQQDTVALQALIDPAAGLWILEQPGAMSLLTRVARATAFRREYQQLPLLSLARQLVDCPAPVSVAQFPRFDCDDQGEGRSGFAQEGCFAGPGLAFQTLDVWPYATLRGGTADQGKAAQQRVLRTVLQTNTGFRFHFGRGADGRWRLLYLDLRVPCSA